MRLFGPLPCCTHLLSQAHIRCPCARLLFSLSGRRPVVFRPTTSFEVVHTLINELLYSTHWDKSATLCCPADCSQSPACFLSTWATCEWGHQIFPPGVTWKRKLLTNVLPNTTERKPRPFFNSRSLSLVDWLLHAGKRLTYILWTLAIWVFNRFMGVFKNLSLKTQLKLWPSTAIG